MYCTVVSEMMEGMYLVQPGAGLVCNVCFIICWSGRRIVVNGMFGQNSVRMAFKQNLAGTVF